MKIRSTIASKSQQNTETGKLLGIVKKKPRRTPPFHLAIPSHTATSPPPLATMSPLLWSVAFYFLWFISFEFFPMCWMNIPIVFDLCGYSCLCCWSWKGIQNILWFSWKVKLSFLLFWEKNKRFTVNEWVEHDRYNIAYLLCYWYHMFVICLCIYYILF